MTSRLIDAFAILADGARIPLNLRGLCPRTLTYRGLTYALRFSKRGVGYYTAGA